VSNFTTSYGAWAVVTGATSGIGLEFARQLASRGQNVVLVARREELLHDVARDLETAYGVKTLGLPRDLSQGDSHENLLEATRDLDAGLLVAAAGFGTAGAFFDISDELERQMISVNCTEVVRQCRDFGRRFARRGAGGIVLMSSLLAFQGVPRSTTYAATKAFVQSLAEGLREEFKPLGVAVIASAPGPVRSGFETRANMRMKMGVTPAVVAEETIAKLGRSGTVVPGGLSKILTYSLSGLGRRMRTAILGSVMADMTRHVT